MIREGVGLLLIAALATFSGSQAQEPTRIAVDAVDVKGLERVGESLVRSQIQIKPGDDLDQRAIGRDIGRIMKLGFFATVKAEFEQVNGKNVLTYTVAEEKTIREIRIVGNKKLKARQIRAAIQWHEGLPFYREGYGEERDAIIAAYRKKGYMNTTVEIIVEPTAPSEVRVTYAITEGKKAKITSITFTGNEAVKKRKLRKAVKTHKAILGLGGRYDQDKFEQDLLNIIDAEGNVGRLEAKIASTQFDYSPNGKKLAVQINIEEGPEYHVDTLALADNFVYRDDELMPLVKVKSGDVHNKGQVTKDAEEIQKLYRNSGYVNAIVAPQVTLDRDKHTTTVSHRINEDELKYLREVRISGNSVTRDDVVRRNILLKPGERFDGSLLEASQRRLEQSQYFKDTRLRKDDVKDTPFTNLLVDVDEGKTGNFNFGAAFNTDTGIGGFGELKLNNFDITDWPTFSGGGQILTANAFLGTKRNNFRLGLTDPEAFGYPFSLGVEVFDETFRGSGSSNFTTTSLGSSVRVGKRLSLYNSASVEFQYNDTKITDLNTFVDPSLRELEDPGSTLSTTFSFNRNTANNFRNPTKGGDHTLSLEVAGFGLDNDFVGLNHDSTFYYGLKRWDRIAFSLRTREGIQFPFGDKQFVPISERFFAGGGSTLRGYDFRGVGPRADTFTVVNGITTVRSEPIGGELRLLQSFEAKYKLTEILRLYAFFDSGAVYFKPEDFDFGGWRFAAGLGIGVDVPFLGPIRIDYGWPLNPDSSQGHGQLHLQSSVKF